MLKTKFKQNIKAQIIIFTLFCLTGILITLFLNLNNFKIDENVNPTNNTIFTVSNENDVFFANSEDGIRNPKIWFSPAMNEDSYGCALLGFAENGSNNDNVVGLAIGGINEEGLCFDANEILPAYFVSYSTSLGLVASYATHWEIILTECSSVSEVIEWYQNHNMGGWWGYQIHWADKTGDAVIVSPTPDRGLAFTRKTNDFLVSTNFNPIDHSQGWYPCRRYELVTNRLEDLSNEGEFYRDELIPILNAVSFPDTEDRFGTIYSNIFELKSRTICLYIQRDFTNEIIFNLDEELNKGSHAYNILALINIPTINRYWVFFLSISFTICLLGIGSLFHFVYKKISRAKK